MTFDVTFLDSIDRGLYIISIFVFYTKVSKKKGQKKVLWGHNNYTTDFRCNWSWGFNSLLWTRGTVCPKGFLMAYVCLFHVKPNTTKIYTILYWKSMEDICNHIGKQLYRFSPSKSNTKPKELWALCLQLKINEE